MFPGVICQIVLRYKVVAVRQEDGAGTHCCKVYKEEISKEFHQSNWLILNKLLYSPVTNVKDAYVYDVVEDTLK